MAELVLVRSMKCALAFAALAAAFLITCSAFAFDWARAESTAGQFSVLLPKPFTELPTDTDIGTVQASKAGLQHTFLVGARPAVGVTFVATKLVYKSIQDARDAVKRTTTDVPPGAKREYMQRGDVAGLPGLEFKLVSQTQVVYSRALVHDDIVFLLVVEAPRDRDDDIHLAAQTFLKSLELQKPK
jgi:hypothetical protein